MKCFFLIVLSLAVSVTLGFGQVTITELMTGNGLEFTNFIADGVPADDPGLLPGGNGGLSLDSNDWRFEGHNTGASTDYGDTVTGGKFRRGTDPGGVGSAGIWAFDVSNGGTVDRALGIQLKDNTFTPGRIELLVENDTGSTVNELRFIYDIYVFNDQDVNQFTLDFEVQGKGTIGGMSYETPAGVDGSPTWQKVGREAHVTGLNWADSTNLFMAWVITDFDSELFDEIALDNIRLAAIPEPSTYALIFGGLALGIVILLKRRTRN